MAIPPELLRTMKKQENKKTTIVEAEDDDSSSFQHRKISLLSKNLSNSNQQYILMNNSIGTNIIKQHNNVTLTTVSDPTKLGCFTVVNHAFTTNTTTMSTQACTTQPSVSSGQLDGNQMMKVLINQNLSQEVQSAIKHQLITTQINKESQKPTTSNTFVQLISNSQSRTSNQSPKASTSRSQYPATIMPRKYVKILSKAAPTFIPISSSFLTNKVPIPRSGTAGINIQDNSMSSELPTSTMLGGIGREILNSGKKLDYTTKIKLLTQANALVKQHSSSSMNVPKSFKVLPAASSTASAPQQGLSVIVNNIPTLTSQTQPQIIAVPVQPVSKYPIVSGHQTVTTLANSQGKPVILVPCRIGNPSKVGKQPAANLKDPFPTFHSLLSDPTPILSSQSNKGIGESSDEPIEIDIDEDSQEGVSPTDSINFYTSVKNVEKGQPVMVMKPVFDDEDDNSKETTTTIGDIENGVGGKIKYVYGPTETKGTQDTTVASCSTDKNIQKASKDDIGTDAPPLNLKIQSVFSLVDLQSSTDEKSSKKTNEETVEMIYDNDDSGSEDFQMECENKGETTFDINDSKWKEVCPPSYAVLERLSHTDVENKKNVQETDNVSVQCSQHCRKRTLSHFCCLNLMHCENRSGFKEDASIGNTDTNYVTQETFSNVNDEEKTNDEIDHRYAARLTTCRVTPSDKSDNEKSHKHSQHLPSTSTENSIDIPADDIDNESKLKYQDPHHKSSTPNISEKTVEISEQELKTLPIENYKAKHSENENDFQSVSQTPATLNSQKKLDTDDQKIDHCTIKTAFSNANFEEKPSKSIGSGHQCNSHQTAPILKCKGKATNEHKHGEETSSKMVCIENTDNERELSVDKQIPSNVKVKVNEKMESPDSKNEQFTASTVRQIEAKSDFEKTQMTGQIFRDNIEQKKSKLDTILSHKNEMEAAHSSTDETQGKSNKRDPNNQVDDKISSKYKSEDIKGLEKMRLSLHMQVETQRLKLKAQKLQHQILKLSREKEDAGHKKHHSASSSKSQPKQSRKKLPVILGKLLKKSPSAAQSSRDKPKDTKTIFKQSLNPRLSNIKKASNSKSANCTSTANQINVVSCSASSIFSRSIISSNEKSLVSTISLGPQSASAKSEGNMKLSARTIYAALKSFADHLKTAGQVAKEMQFIMIKSGDTPIILKVSRDALLPKNLEALKNLAMSSPPANSTGQNKPMHQNINASPKVTSNLTTPSHSLSRTVGIQKQKSQNSSSSNSSPSQPVPRIVQCSAQKKSYTSLLPPVIRETASNFIPNTTKSSSVNPPPLNSPLRSLLTSSPLTRVPLSSGLLPERREKRPSAKLSEKERAEKRRKLEEKYPLPPGVIIKSEPDSSEYDLDSNWSVTTDIQTGYVTTPDSSMSNEIQNSGLTDNNSASSDIRNSIAVQNQYLVKSDNTNTNIELMPMEGADPFLPVNSTEDNVTFETADETVENADSPPPLDSIAFSGIDKDPVSSQNEINEDNDCPPILQPMPSLLSSTYGQNNGRQVSNQGVEQSSCTLTQDAHQTIKKVCDSGYDSVGQSSSSESVSSGISKQNRPSSKLYRIQQLKALLKQKEQQVEDIRKKRSALPAMDLDSL